MPKTPAHSSRFWVAVVIGALVGLIYNSWVLGYRLNPKVTGSALASLLGAVGEPYNWVFIWGDVLCGLLILIICILSYKRDKNVLISLGGLAVFALMTAASALIPIHCGGIASTCDFNKIFDWHDATGAVAGLGQFVGMLYATILAKKLTIYKWDKLFLWIWVVLGASYLLTGIPAINHLKEITTIAVIWQDIFLVISGLLVFLSAWTYMEFKEKSKLASGSR